MCYKMLDHPYLPITHLVELLSLAVLGQHAAEDAHTTDPEELDWHTGIGSTLALTSTSVATLAAGLGVQSCAGTRVNNNWLADDQTVLDETSDLVATQVIFRLSKQKLTESWH